MFVVMILILVVLVAILGFIMWQRIYLSPKERLLLLLTLRAEFNQRYLLFDLPIDEYMLRSEEYFDEQRKTLKL